jgi:hypothetical protein
VEDESFDLASYYEGELQSGLAELSEPKTVPLTIYIDDQKHIVGKATVIGRKVHAQIDPSDGRNLETLISTGIITSVSVTFNTDGPAHPEQEFAAKEIKKYTFEPRAPFPRATQNVGEFRKQWLNPEFKYPPRDGIDYVGLESKPTVVEPFDQK